MTRRITARDYSFLLIVFFVGFSQVFLYVPHGLVIFFFEIFTILFYQKDGIFRITYQDKKSVFLIIFWMFSLTLSMILNNRCETASIFRFIETLTHILFAYHLAQKLFEERYLIYFCYAIITPVIIVTFSMIYIYYYPDSLYSNAIYALKGDVKSPDWFENPPFYNHIRHAGYQVNIALVCSVFLIAYFLKKNSFVFLANVLIFLILSSFLIWTGGRGSILSVVLSLSIAFILSSQFRKPVAMAFCCFIFSVYIAELFRVFEWNGIFRVYNSFSSENIETISSGRSSLWREALNTLNIKNIWFGHGAESFLLLHILEFRSHPHNFIIQFLMEWGLVGTTVFFAFIYNVFNPLFKVKNIILIVKQDATALLPIMIITSTVSLAFTDGSLFYSQPIFYLCLAFALLYKYQQSLPIKRKDKLIDSTVITDHSLSG